MTSAVEAKFKLTVGDDNAAFSGVVPAVVEEFE